MAHAPASKAHITAAVPRHEKPCWQCHWYGYMVDEDAAFCLHPEGLAIRPAALYGCCSYTLEPCMDTGSLAPRPAPTPSRSACAQRMLAQREQLVELRLQLGFNKAPWEKRRRIVSRLGTLSDDET
ncbi:MAG: hypothetical protein ACK44A_05500 [Roseateles sp.]